MGKDTLRQGGSHSELGENNHHGHMDSGWKRHLQNIIDKHAGTRVNGNVASFRTREQAATELFAAFKTLHELGFRLQNPANLNERHVLALVQHWYRNNRAASTMRQNLSVLRKFGTWIGKAGMVKALPAYLPSVDGNELKTTSVLTASKSWSANGIDVEAKIAQADALNERFGLMLRVALAFGFRRMEVIMLKPWSADRGDALMVYANRGPKGGRARPVPITTAFQREVLDYVKARTPKTHHLGWNTTRRGKPATLKYCQAEYLRCMRQIGITRKQLGVTGHGLRAEYAENESLLCGVVPPTLGGKGDEVSPEELAVIKSHVSENLGHSRTSVTASYYGSFKGLRQVRKQGPVDSAPEETPAPSTSSRPLVQDAKHVVLTPAERREEASRRRAVRRDADEVDARQMHLPLTGSVAIFRRKPRDPE